MTQREVARAASTAKSKLEELLEEINTKELGPAIKKAAKLIGSPYCGSGGLEFRNAVRDIENALEKIRAINHSMTELNLVSYHPARPSDSIGQDIKKVIIEATLVQG